jgi:putative transposase
MLKIYIHLIWTTKYRTPVLIDCKRRLILNKIRSIAKQKGYHIIIINGSADHVHCLLRLGHSHMISRITNDLKGVSASWINKNNIAGTFPGWQDGYAAISVSPENVQRTIKYIKNQDLHHKQHRR